MKTTLILGTAALCLALCGCVQVESRTVLNKDGSGTVDLIYSMDVEVEQALNEMQSIDMGMDEDMGSAPMFGDDFDMEAHKKELAQHGVKVERYENGIENGQRVVRMTLAFADVDGLQAAMALSGGSDEVMGIRKLESGDYVLTNVPAPDTGEGDEEDVSSMEDMNPEDMSAAMANAAKSVELMGVLMSHAQDLKIAYAITFPSEVLSHNANRLDGRTCYWEMDSSNMMDQQGMAEPEVVFSGQGLKIDAPAR